MRTVAWIALLAVICAATAPREAVAQDSHYWSNQYGTRANLLGGVVVGGVTALSAAYYNPGGMAMGEDKLGLSTDAIEFTKIRVENGGGVGIDLESTQSGTAPKLFALSLNAHIVEGDRLAVALLTRHDFKFDVDARVIDQRSIIEPPGTEDFSGEVRLEQRLYEGWYGFAWSKPMSDKVGIGVSTYLVYRGQRGRAQTIGQAVNSTDGAAIVVWDEYEYNNWRALWKIGTFFGDQNASWGFAVTTPSWDLGGQGLTDVNVASIAVPDSMGNPQSSLTSNFQDQLRARYKSPLSASIGGRKKMGANKLWGTVEWFDALRKFNVLDPADFQAQSTGETINADVHGAARSVLNWGVGYERVFGASSFFVAFTNDRSYATADDDLAITSWHVYHTTAGGAVSLGAIDVTGGFVFGLGRKQAEGFVDLSDSDNGLEPDPNDELTVSFRRFRILFGFSVGL